MTATEKRIPIVSRQRKKKQIITQKLVKLKKKLTDHSHDEYIINSEFNKATKEVFDARLK